MNKQLQYREERRGCKPNTVLLNKKEAHIKELERLMHELRSNYELQIATLKQEHTKLKNEQVSSREVTEDPVSVLH